MSRIVAVLLLALLSVPMASANVHHLPPAVVADSPELRLLGAGRMRWFGLLLYDASLWVNGAEWQWDRPFALDLHYAREFSGRRIAEASADEIRRMGLADPARIDGWRAEMLRVFPDVKSGDRITGVYRPGEGAEFFLHGRSIGAIRDPEFARVFFSIWLDTRTREPRLRAALLGRK